MLKNKLSVPYLHHRRWSETEASAVLSALESSGLSTAEFARHHGLDPQRLYRWRRQLDESFEAASAPPPPARSPSAPALIEIHPRRAEPVEIILGSGRVLRVSETIDPAALARLIGVLDRSHGC